MAHQDDASQSAAPLNEPASSKVVEIGKPFLISRGKAKRESAGAGEHARSNVVEIGNWSFLRSILSTVKHKS